MKDDDMPELPWGLDSSKLAKGSKDSITQDKIKGFQIGNQTKSRFQKHKEEQEAKKKQEEEEAAKVFEDFVASFETDGTAKPKGFVRGEVVQKGSNPLGSNAGPLVRPGEVYSMIPKHETYREEKQSFDPKKSPTETKGINKAHNKKRGIEELMKELRGTTPASKAQKTEELIASHFRDMGQGSFDDGDENTTNLYVGNLHPQISEEMLMKEFGKYGPIASVKIMWPRTDEEKSRQRNCGFVNMMDRKSAEAAKDSLNGKEFFGLEMRIGWGKAMSKGAVPCYAMKPGEKEEPVLFRRTGEVTVKFPKSNDVRQMIDKMAEYVVKEGHEFEKAILNREKDNPLFEFLWDVDSRNGVYYKWKVFSLAQGDSQTDWRRAPFQMFVGGVVWTPPGDVESAPPPLERKKSRSRSRSPGHGNSGAALTDGEVEELQSMLRSMTAEREDIGDAMYWSIRRAEAAQDIVDIIAQSLTILKTPIPTKIARLFLVSDILHNSSAAVKKASMFRTCFEKTMPQIFEALGEKLRSPDVGRMTAEAMKDKVLRVLRVWEVWCIYPNDMIQQLEDTFLGNASSKAPAKPSADSHDRLGAEKSIDGESLDGEPLDGESLDGEPLDGESLDGEPLDGEPLDGEPLDGESLDGEPLDE